MLPGGISHYQLGFDGHPGDTDGFSIQLLEKQADRLPNHNVVVQAEACQVDPAGLLRDDRIAGDNGNVLGHLEMVFDGGVVNRQRSRNRI